MSSSLRRGSRSKMISLVVWFAVSIAFSECGSIRHSLFELPTPVATNRDFLRDHLLPRGFEYFVQEGPKNDVSYSLSFEDYQYLKQRKIEGQDVPQNPEASLPISTKNDDQSVKYKRNHVKHDGPCPDAVLKRSAGTNSINGYNNILVSAPVEPIVHKHVYFHVPPPDFEEPPSAPRIIPPTNKNINILFIKVPSFDSNRSHLQQLLSAQTPVEDKTLIYVLSKKEEESQPVVLPPKPSSPEVYFVKYKTRNDIEPINNELSLPSLLQNVSPVLDRKREVRDP